jgi:hypothetical protein
VTRSVAEAARAVLTAAEPLAKVKAARLRRATGGWAGSRIASTSRCPIGRPGPSMPGAAAAQPHAEARQGRLRARPHRADPRAGAYRIRRDRPGLRLRSGGSAGSSARGFTDDWMQVGADEAMHFALLDRRLKQLGSHYGAMPAHDGLWDAAAETAHDALARLAVVPMVLEARGLDVTPATIERFEAAGDRATARILTRILNDEIRHVRAGTNLVRIGMRAARFRPRNDLAMLVGTPFSRSA